MWWAVVVGILLIWGILIMYSWFEEVVLKEEVGDYPMDRYMGQEEKEKE